MSASEWQLFLSRARRDPVRWRKVRVAVLGLTLLTCACIAAETSAPASPNGRAEAGAFAINRQIGRGVNIGNALEAPVEGQWGVTIEEEYFDRIRNAGFNSVRIAIDWPAHALPGNPFTVDPEFFKRIDQVIGQTTARDVIVILTLHYFGLHDPKAKAWRKGLLEAVIPPSTSPAPGAMRK